jgi:hypothetical protein
MREDMLRNVLVGFIQIHIAHHAGEAPVYGRTSGAGLAERRSRRARRG